MSEDKAGGAPWSHNRDSMCTYKAYVAYWVPRHIKYTNAACQYFIPAGFNKPDNVMQGQGHSCAAILAFLAS